MSKEYRRFIRLDGKIKASPKFTRKADAESWYQEMLKKKHFEKHDLNYIARDEGTTVIEYSRIWLAEREKNYPRATTMADEQRLRDYILPLLAEKPIARVSSADVQVFLRRIGQAGFRIKDKRISDNTRNKVKVLLSTIFTDAMNEEPPLVSRNPVAGVQVKEKGRRIGKKEPVYLGTTADCLKFLKAAREIGGRVYPAVALLLMSGLRKQELIALRWGGVDLSGGLLMLSEKYEQATNSIIRGTKAGEEQGRVVPIPQELVRILIEWRSNVGQRSAWDFVFTDVRSLARGGRAHFTGREVSNWIEDVRARAGIHCTVHGLRHTYGREFAMRAGNIKALQGILGHSSSQMTDMYSDLGGQRLRSFGETVSFKEEKGES